ncbi:MAG: hypothetical protein AUJ81_00375 [Helicobacteraceae bacterium CG1_02_36_14]|nr:MAG: hypothetical protein AUJ81_00375 [Helicobacteraceae bacterium CG1_02_36_14]
MCHLYCKTTDSPQAKSILNSFEGSVSIDISTIETLASYGVYIVEVYKVDKDISEKFKKLFEDKIDSLIYFIVPNEYSLTLFQLAFLLKAKTIITANQDVNRLILKLRSDYKLNQEEHLHNMLGQIVLKTESFIFFKNNELTYASQKLFDTFGWKDLSQVEKNICKQLPLHELLSQDTVTQQQLTLHENSNAYFDIRSSTTEKVEEKFIFLELLKEHVSSEDELSFVSNRISFIEVVKEKFIEQSISSKKISFMTIQIENLKSLQNDWSKVEVEGFLKDFLFEVDKIVDKKIILAQYDSDFYIVIFEDITLELLKSKADNFQHKISGFLSEQQFNPFIDIYAFDTTTLDLNDILSTLGKISNKSITQKDIAKDKLIYIGNAHDKMDEQESIKHLLREVYTNSIQIKLLNIYKGLCINTSATIVKYNEDGVYIKFEHFQGIVMKLEKETVLQSSSFSQDIKAKVKFINLEKKIALVEGFSFVNGNANARKYSRVSCSARTPIIISQFGATLSGEILDISISSIAVQLKYAKLVDHIRADTVMLSFVLPNRNSLEGSVKISVEAKVILSTCKDGICKIVCELLKDDVNESILMEYVYNRQKEIIVEVKKIARQF